LTSYKNTFNNLKQQAPNGTLFDWSEVTHIIHYFAKAIDISRGEAICDWSSFVRYVWVPWRKKWRMCSRNPFLPSESWRAKNIFIFIIYSETFSYLGHFSYSTIFSKLIFWPDKKTCITSLTTTIHLETGSKRCELS